MKTRLKRESRLGHWWRKRMAKRKITVPKGTTSAITPLGPVHTHLDTATINRALANVARIAAHAEEESHDVHQRIGQAEADQAAAEDAARRLEDEQTTALKHRTDFEKKVNGLGLGHRLVRRLLVGGLTAIVMIAAIGFETLSMATPASLMAVIDLGASRQTEERVAVGAALLLALAYAVVLALLSEHAGAQLRAREFRNILEGEHLDDAAAEDRPPTKHNLVAGRMILLAVGAGSLALLGASLVREAAVAIVTSSGDTGGVLVAWQAFAALTLSVFVALVCVGYWGSNPIAMTYGEINDGIKKRGKQIGAQRHESYHAAGRIDACNTELEMIEARSQSQRRAEIHAAAEEIAWRAGANAHIYGVTVEPSTIQDIIKDPGKHIDDLTLPALERTLIARIQEIRDRLTGSPDEAQHSTP